MAIVGTFHITGSFTLTGRGLILVGDITGGKVKVGDYLTFTAGKERITLKIGGVGMGRSVGRETDYVGLTFSYSNEEERKRYEGIRLSEQDINIMDSPDETQ